jgi:hypothetical protein
MQQAMLGIEDHKPVFHKLMLVLNTYLLKCISKLYIDVVNIINIRYLKILNKVSFLFKLLHPVLLNNYLKSQCEYSSTVYKSILEIEG